MDAVITQLQTDGVLPTAADFPKFAAAADRTDFVNKLSTYLQVQLPPDFGQIPIANESSVDAIGTALHLFDQALIGLIVLSIILALAALIFADRHWNALAWLGFTSVFIFGLLVARPWSACDRSRMMLWPIPTTASCLPPWCAAWPNHSRSG